MSLHPCFPQLIEMGTPTVRTLEHELHAERVEQICSPPGVGLRLDLLLYEIDRAPEHTLFDEARNVEDESPEGSPEIPEELIDEQVPGTADVPEPRDSSDDLRFGLTHVVTS